MILILPTGHCKKCWNLVHSLNLNVVSPASVCCDCPARGLNAFCWDSLPGLAVSVCWEDCKIYEWKPSSCFAFCRRYHCMVCCENIKSARFGWLLVRHAAPLTSVFVTQSTFVHYAIELNLLSLTRLCCTSTCAIFHISIMYAHLGPLIQSLQWDNLCIIM